MKSISSLVMMTCLFALMVCPASADMTEIPTLPAQFCGTLYNHEGKPFPVGTVIIAEVNGVISTYTITEAGKLGGSGTFDDKFLINGAVVGSDITFKIEGTNIEVKQTYNPSSSQQIEEIQLIIPVTLSDSTNIGGSALSSTGNYNPPNIKPNEPEDDGEPLHPSEEKPIPEQPSPSKTPYPIVTSILTLVGVAIFAGRK